MHVNYDFMHPCSHCRFTSEHSIHIEQTLKPVSNLSLCQFVSFIDEVGHDKLNKCRCSGLFSAGTLENKTTMTSGARKCKTSRCASNSRCTVMWSQAWLSVCHSQQSLNDTTAKHRRKTLVCFLHSVNHHDLFKHVFAAVKLTIMPDVSCPFSQHMGF